MPKEPIPPHPALQPNTSWPVEEHSIRGVRPVGTALVIITTTIREAYPPFRLTHPLQTSKGSSIEEIKVNLSGETPVIHEKNEKECGA